MRLDLVPGCQYAAGMKRITVSLPDELNRLLEKERERRNVLVAVIIREALSTYLAGGEQPRLLPFIGLGRSGHHDTARSIDEILDEECGASGHR
jgi:hypothetical protein